MIIILFYFFLLSSSPKNHKSENKSSSSPKNDVYPFYDRRYDHRFNLKNWILVMKIFVTGVIGNTGRSFLYSIYGVLSSHKETLVEENSPRRKSRKKSFNPMIFSQDISVTACIPKISCEILESLQKEFPKVEFVILDLDSESAVFNTKDAMKDCDSLYIVPSCSRTRVDHSKVFVKAAMECGIGFILLASIIGAEEGDNPWSKEFKEMENCVLESNIPFCFLRCSLFMEILFGFSDSIQEGFLELPIGDGRFSLISVEDVSRIAW
jgi:hypothetical protein